MISTNASDYTIGHLLRVAFPNSEDLSYSAVVVGETLVVQLPHSVTLQIQMLSEAETDQLKSGNLSAKNQLSADQSITIPLFQPKSSTYNEPFFDHNTAILHLPYDLITISFLLLSQSEEYGNVTRDKHQRASYVGSISDRYNLIEFPLVDEYALLLRLWITTLCPRSPQFKVRTPRTIPTHDIDLLYRFHSPWQAIRSIIGRDLLLNRSFSQATESATAYIASLKDKFNDPYLYAISELIRESTQQQLSSIFFVKAQQKGEPDARYDVHDVNLRKALEAIQDAGMQIGLHGSYLSYNQSNLFQQELQRLQSIINQLVTLNRQHYLRCHLEQTLHIWEQSGITDDYTLGYAEQPGFRCGTCHPYPLYDLAHDRVTNITEHPLIVMDGSLFDYLHLSIEQSNKLVSKLKARCHAVEGDFVILWHTHWLSRNYRTAFEQIYLPQLRT